MKILLVLGLVHFAARTFGARILGVFPAPSYSHHALGSRLMEEFASRGHEVTVISPFSHSAQKNFKTVQLEGFVEQQEEKKNIYDRSDRIHTVFIDIVLNVLFVNATEEILAQPAVQNFLKSDAKFDVVIVDEFLLHALRGFCYHFKAPCVTFSSVGLSRMVSSQVANPMCPSYISELSLGYGSKMSFLQRLHNTFVHVFGELFRNLYVMCKHNKILQEYFPGSPHMRQLYYNVSLVLLNSHVSVHPAVPYVPNVIDIGGFHVQPPKKLPKDLQDFLNSAKEGVIVFSMGTNLKSTDMHLEKRQAILRTFAGLKQKVLWKWEDEDLLGKPPNVKIMKWFPQADVLAHRNVKVFLTHGGLLSTIEAVYHGVPIIGVPLFGDQRMNIANAVEKGYGLLVPYADVSEKTLGEAIKNVLTNPEFRENAQLHSEIMHNQPIKPIDKAVFWVEYVIKFKGARHLRSAALELYWFQYVMLDIILLLVFAVLIVLIVALLALLYILRLRRSVTDNDKKTR